MKYDNQGGLWANKRRERDSQPKWTGSATIGGVDYYVSAWPRDDDAPENKPLLKLSFKAKDELATPTQPRMDTPEDLDEVPF